MTKRKNRTTLTPKCERLKVINTNSVIISRNNGRKIKTQKSHKSSPTSHIVTKALPKVKNCALKLKRFKMPPLVSASDHFDEVSNAPIQVAQSTPNTTTKCRVRLSRVSHSTEEDSLLQATTMQNNPPRTHSLRRNKSKENTKNGINGVIQTGASRKLRCHENKNDIENNQNPLMCDDVAIKSSTPLKPAAPFQREPFKVLNLQEVIREVDPVDHIRQILNKQPIITKENRESLKKLSLSRSKTPQKFRKHNKIVHFEPLRNSTLYAVDIQSNTKNVVITCAKSLQISCQLDDTAMESEKNLKKTDADKRDEHSIEKSQSSFKNLANRSDLIEQLLLSDNDEEKSVVDQQSQRNEAHAASKTNKFFHRTLETSKNPKNILITKIQPVKNKRLSLKKRLTQRGKSVGSVYEFLSQSQTSDSDTANKKLDPAADIIKKLIAEGKVRVATHKKGSGKLTIKRKNIPKKRAVVQRKKPSKKNIKKAGENNDVEPYVDNDDMLHDGFDEPHILDEPEPIVEEAAAIQASNKSHDTSTGGDTFSNLARSVLISETKKKENSHRKITYQRKLLEAAQKFVSTPVRQYGSPLEKTAIMSPIMPQDAPHAEEGDTSPWRVDDDAHLPSVFYFSRNSGNLPSFSSDYIPPSPRKQKHRYQDLLPEPELHEPSFPLNNDHDSQSPIIPTFGVELSKHSSSSLSSFSSNDSNAENKPPVASVSNPSTPDRENSNLINQRQQLNPRRELSNRSPLQILDVISLPPWNSSKQQYTIAKKNQNTSNNATLHNQPTKGNISDLFGFEEFLEDDNVEDDQQMPVTVTERSNNTSFRNKLHDLKHLLPAQRKIPQSSSSNQIADVFDGQSGGRQLQIKEMLCSTMINQGKGKEALPMKRNNRINEENASTKKCTNEPSELFIDPDYQASFNEKDSLRTYIRPYKRKRKLRHNFVMFLDSDESGEDDEAHQKNNSDTSKELEVEHKKKKNKKEQKDIVELNSFVNEFNDICKEVDKYELIVE